MDEIQRQDSHFAADIETGRFRSSTRTKQATAEAGDYPRVQCPWVEFWLDIHTRVEDAKHLELMENLKLQIIGLSKTLCDTQIKLLGHEPRAPLSNRFDQFKINNDLNLTYNSRRFGHNDPEDDEVIKECIKFFWNILLKEDCDYDNNRGRSELAKNILFFTLPYYLAIDFNREIDLLLKESKTSYHEETKSSKLDFPIAINRYIIKNYRGPMLAPYVCSGLRILNVANESKQSSPVNFYTDSVQYVIEDYCKHNQTRNVLGVDDVKADVNGEGKEALDKVKTTSFYPNAYTISSSPTEFYTTVEQGTEYKIPLEHIHVALLSVAEGETVEVQFRGWYDNNISYIYRKLTILTSIKDEEAKCCEVCFLPCLLAWTIEKYEKGKCTTSCFCDRKLCKCCPSPCCVIKGHTKHFGWLAIILGLVFLFSWMTNE